MSSSEHSRLQRAIALRYTEGEAVPTVAAAGDGVIAERILERARELGIPIHEDPELVEAMARLRQGDAIPESLYLAVAQVIAWVFTVASQD